MSKLDQVNEMIKVTENIIKLDIKHEQSKGYHWGWKDGFDTAKKIYCQHPANAVESEFSEDEQYAFCTLCEKDLTEEYISKMPEYDDPERDTLPF